MPDQKTQDHTYLSLLLGQGHDHPGLYHKYLKASNPHWISSNPPEKDILNAKIRYRSNDIACKIIDLDINNIVVKFEQPCFAIAPGQSIVFYDKNICLGGAIIDSYSN